MSRSRSPPLEAGEEWNLIVGPVDRAAGIRSRRNGFKDHALFAAPQKNELST
jgi:hypothetical protein